MIGKGVGWKGEKAVDSYSLQDAIRQGKILSFFPDEKKKKVVQEKEQEGR